MMQDYGELTQYPPDKLWNRWQNRDNDVRDTLGGILEFVRVLGGRHLSEKTTRLVLVIWLLCTRRCFNAAISLSQTEKRVLLKQVKQEAATTLVGTCAEHVRCLPRKFADFRTQFPLTFALAYSDGDEGPGTCPFSDSDIQSLASTIRCRGPKESAKMVSQKRMIQVRLEDDEKPAARPPVQEILMAVLPVMQQLMQGIKVPMQDKYANLVPSPHAFGISRIAEYSIAE